jgi:hypothetical protein
MPSIAIILIISAFIYIIWINSIDKTNNQYIDYKGEDFLDEDDKIQIG